MSACPQPSIQHHATNIRAVCKTPLSYLYRLLQILNYTELKIFGIVLDKSIGWSEDSAEMTPEDFCEGTGRSREFWQESLVNLIDNRKFIRMYRGERGRMRYAVAQSLADETKADRIRGKCSKCQTVGFFDREFVPFPHTFFQNLPTCVSHACYLVTAAICRYSLKWNRDRGLWSEEVELNKSDIERVTDQDPRSITDGLAEAVKLGIVSRIERKGNQAGDIYWVNPEMFGKLKQLGPRLVTPPERGSERTGKSNSEKPVKPPQKPTVTQANESAADYFGICKKCGHFGAAEPSTEPVPTEISPGPLKNESPPLKKGPSRMDKMWDSLSNWHKKEG